MKTIHITTGDTEGIGLETSVKALVTMGPQKNTQFILWRSPQANREMLSRLDDRFKRLCLNEKNFFSTPPKEKKENILLDLASPSGPTTWVVKATQLCLQNKNSRALVTGPLSKTQMQKENFKEKGHTDLLKKLSRAENVFMTFMGKFFNVIPLTGHVPLKKVKWSEKTLNECLKLCFQIKNDFYSGPKNKKAAVLGFNPHAGEEGLLGMEEIPLKKALLKWNPRVEGPLVPDTAFFKSNWHRYFVYICLYHDQALIPFKMIHERKSFQFSLGLPFIRTSVSHGTAKDIFGKDQADERSMKEALKGALLFLKKDGPYSK